MTDVSTTPQQEQNKELVRRIPEEVFGEGNLDLLDELYAKDAVEHNAMGTHHGQTEIQASFEAFLTAFPDMSQTVENVVAEDDTVPYTSRVRGHTRGNSRGSNQPETRLRWTKCSSSISRTGRSLNGGSCQITSVYCNSSVSSNSHLSNVVQNSEDTQQTPQLTSL